MKRKDLRPGMTVWVRKDRDGKYGTEHTVLDTRLWANTRTWAKGKREVTLENGETRELWVGYSPGTGGGVLTMEKGSTYVQVTPLGKIVAEATPEWLAEREARREAERRAADAARDASRARHDAASATADAATRAGYPTWVHGSGDSVTLGTATMARLLAAAGIINERGIEETDV